jgi:hypothetical protein
MFAGTSDATLLHRLATLNPAKLNTPHKCLDVIEQWRVLLILLHDRNLLTAPRYKQWLDGESFLEKAAQDAREQTGFVA